MLAIVAYEQPVTHADIRSIRGVDSDGPVETLIARELIVADPRFGGRGRPAFLITSTFLRRFALASLSDLAPRQPVVSHQLLAVSSNVLPSAPANGDNQRAERTGDHGC